MKKILLLISIYFSAQSIFAQGGLTPAGSPAPLFKTLQQVEPRTPISAIPISITTAGSYYLTTNLIGASGSNGIVILTDNVTIDLNGFVLEGVSNSISGISAASFRTNLTLFNGTVRGWGSFGVAASLIKNVRMHGVLVAQNAASGLAVGDNGVVTDCTALANGGNGITVSPGSRVRDCTAINNSNNGIGAGIGSSIVGCVVSGNGTNGISVLGSCLVTGNECNTNFLAQILIAGPANRIDGNHCFGGQRGIQATATDNLIIRNSVRGATVLAYDIIPGNHDAMRITSPGASFTNSNPWANFSF